MFCLRVATDEAWARAALDRLDDVLIDHAHCEMKAATNALSLVVRHPQDLELVAALTEIAREELDHFQRVVAFIKQRGLDLGTPPIDDYAEKLRKAMNKLRHNTAKLDIPLVVDRLLIGALIEARSCERFKLLLDAWPEGSEPELRAFYFELFTCEARHYRHYVDLAVMGAGGEPMRELIEGRLKKLAEDEAAIVRDLATLTHEERGSVHG